MKKVILIANLILFVQVYAVNDLSVREHKFHPRTGPGYIDEAVLVVEPYGAYTEQSLYIKYSDHNQFNLPANQNMVITHKFELPEGAVVNDLWLWIGDSVMQARIYERKHAQGIWDTVTWLEKDPAFLKVDNNKYDLRVYPLTPGSFRKIKLNYVVPTKFIKKKPYVDLSYKFLRADNNYGTPLKIMFRAQDCNWGDPVIVEDLSIKVCGLVDTLGKQYKNLYIDDLKRLSSLTLTYDVNFIKGEFSAISRADSNVYFSFGLYENEYFSTPFINQKSKKVFVGIDLSGFYGLDSGQVVSRDLSSFFPYYLQEGDTFKVVIAGEGIIDTFPKKSWFIADEDTLSYIINTLESSNVVSAIKNRKKPRILFSDGGDGGNWYFEDLNKLANVTLKANAHDGFYENRNTFNSYDIVTAYWHSTIGKLNNQQLDEMKSIMDVFFNNGGVLVMAHGYETSIAHKYITGLGIGTADFNSGMLHRNPDGPIGRGFPNSFHCVNYFTPIVHSDPDVVNEVLTEDNKPVVISKKILNGRLVISTMWHKHDSQGQKKVVCTAQLNLQNQSRHRQLKDVLNNMVTTYGEEAFTEALIMSNSDAIITEGNLEASISPVKLDAISEIPVIKTVNILSGERYIPPVYNINNADYYGSSFCLKHISDLTGGIYMSRHLDTWDYIGSVLGQKVHFQYEKFTMNLFADGNPVTTKIYGLLPSITNFDRAQFFTGKTPKADSIRLSFEVKYKGFDSTYTNSSTMYLQNNNETKDIALRTMYENEVLKEMFLQTPLDTLAITKYAVSHRILNDFTSFIALEPNDTIPFITDPNDETNYWTVDVVKKQNVVKNPFIFSVLKENNQIKFTFQTEASGTIVFKIFNLLGRTVYSKTIQSRGNHTLHTICRNGDLGKGTYIAVAKFVYKDKERSFITKQKIEKFTVVN